jgi:hypothetical protein
MSAEEPWSWRPVEPQRHHTKGMLRKDSLLPMGRMGGNLEVRSLMFSNIITLFFLGPLENEWSI